MCKKVGGGSRPFLLQKFSEPIHHDVLMLHKAVNITIERDGGIFVTEDLRQSFHVHATLEGTGGEGMPEGMKASVRDM